MSISSAILALSPTVYCKLDDASGPTFVDSSGNGHNQTAIGSPVFRAQPGPETGTFAVQLPAAAGLSFTNPWTAPTANFTVMAYLAISDIVSPDLGSILGATAPFRGASILGHTTWQVGPNFATVYGHGTQPWVTVSDMKRWWHHYAVTFTWTSATTFTVTVYVDASLQAQYSEQLGFTADIRLGASDPVFLLPAYPCIAAHFAAFNSTLNVTQLSTIANQQVTWPIAFPPGLTGLYSGDPTVTDLVADLDAILAAVRKTFPSTP